MGTKKRNTVLSAIIFILSVVVAGIFYMVIFNKYQSVWTFNAIFYLCMVTFTCGFGIFIGAIVLERKVD
jgi:hypothetical protein